MKIVVPVKLVPDLVDEFEIDSSGKTLDTTFMRLILNEFDEHAIEQAVLLKERSGGTITVITPENDGADDALYTAAARGADKLIKLTGDLMGMGTSHALAAALSPAVKDESADLILTGVQAYDSYDGPIGPLLAESLNIPYVGYVSSVNVSDGVCRVHKEYPGGVTAEVEVQLPAVLGIQAAEEPPRYIAISKVRQAMKSSSLVELAAEVTGAEGAPTLERMYLPETGEKAVMLSGNEDQVADQIIEVLKEIGIL